MGLLFWYFKSCMWKEFKLVPDIASRGQEAQVFISVPAGLVLAGASRGPAALAPG